MELKELLLTAGRGFAVYALMLIVIRLLGKRSIGVFSPFDLVVALMLGEMVDEIIYGDVSLLQGATAVVSIATAQYLLEWFTFKSRKVERAAEGIPTVVIKNGQLQPKGMLQERVSEDELLSLLREQGVDDLREVKLGTLECSGHLSVIKEPWAEPVQKGDLKGEEARQKQRDTKGREEPPPEKQTGSPQALGQGVT